MIPRSLPPLPPQISGESSPRAVDSCHVDPSSGTGTGVSPVKRSRPKRKKKSNCDSRNSHLQNTAEEKYTDGKDGESRQCSHVSDNHNPLLLPPERTASTKIGNTSVLDRLKLKRQNVRDEESSEVRDEQAIESTSKNQEKLPVSLSNYLNASLVSQPIAKMFIEEESGFRVISDVTGPVSQAQAGTCDNQPPKEVQSAVEIAVKTEKFFHTFSTFCHGLLAGMALWQCIIVFQLGPPHFETADFFSHYSSLSQPMQTLFYFFFVICIVSAFDRYDIGNPQHSNIKCALTCRSGIIIVIVYPISLILSLAVANIDDKMTLYNYNASLWTAENVVDLEHDLFYWKVLNLGRCVGAVIGWIIVALQPNVNNFLQRLEYVDCAIK